MSKELKLSPQQSAAVEWMRSGEGSAVVVAVAGSGKTFLLTRMAAVIPQELSVKVLVFNKKNADEMGPKFRKVRPKMWTSTFHSACMGAYKRWRKGVQVEPKKVWSLIDQYAAAQGGEEAARAWSSDYGSFVNRLVGLAKNEGVGYLVPDSDDTWFALIQHHDLFLEAEGTTEEEAVRAARAVLRRNNEQLDVIDYDDMLYLSLLNNLRFWQEDVLMVDEAQDTNPVQRALMKRMLKKGGRLVAVGDPHQAIYGFRGATSDALERIKREFSAIELSLTYTYRCPQRAVALAQRYVSHIEAHPDAPEGHEWRLDAQMYLLEADGVPYDDPRANGPVKFRSTDAILCRQTAPLVEQAYKLIAAGTGCRILGREIGQGLVNLVEKMRAKGVDQLQNKLEAWAGRETAKALSKGQEDKAQTIEDRVACIRTVIDNLDENARTVPEVERRLAALFTDNGEGLLTLCTVHKAKGLEWDRVFVLRPDLMPSKWARQDWQREQENNLLYVCGTRTKDTIAFISSP